MAGPSLLGILDMLPQILGVLQITMYVVLSWVLGTLAFYGMKKRLPFGMKIVVTFGIGFVCLLIGIAISEFLLFFKGTIFETIQLDLLLGGIIGAVLIAAALYMITRKEQDVGKEGMIKKLRERISLLTGILIKNDVPTLKENEAKKTAEALVPGYEAKEAKLKKTDWEILLQKEDKHAVVVLGAYTGVVKGVHYLGMEHLLHDPLRIVGIGLIIGLLAFGLINFTGFPSIMEDIASLLGMSPEQLEAFTSPSQNLPEGCVAAVRILMSKGISVLGGESTYTNEAVGQMIEERNPGRVVALMYDTQYEGNDYILSITLPSDMNFSELSNDEIIRNAEICVSTETVFCECITLPDVSSSIPTGFIIAL